LRDSRFVSSIRPPAIAASGPIVEPPGATPAARTKVREAASALQRACRELTERIGERMQRDRTASEAASHEVLLGLAPAAARTNVYLWANARVLAGHCEKLISSPQAEVAAAGRAMLEALRARAPDLISDAQRSKMRAAAPELIEGAVAHLTSSFE